MHPRMPVILSPENGNRWLNLDASQQEGETELLKVLASTPKDFLTYTEVSNRVNSTRHDDLACLSAVA